MLRRTALSPDLIRADNVEQNMLHYDAAYHQIGIESTIARLRHLETFLSDAIKTDTSWHGMYHGGFENRLAGKRVLELGCGNGTNALVMAALGAEVVALDISKESERIIRQAAERLQFSETRLLPVTGDFTELSFRERSFDFVVGKAFLHHLTHDLEDEYLSRVARLLKPDGEARFFEPATNSALLDRIRWHVPVPGRPSRMNKRAFSEWKVRDPHPERSNASADYAECARQFFDEIQVVPIGSIERIHRLLPGGTFNRRFRRWAHRLDPKLPYWFRYYFARSQVLIYRQPRAVAQAGSLCYGARPLDRVNQVVAQASRRPTGRLPRTTSSQHS